MTTPDRRPTGPAAFVVWLLAVGVPLCLAVILLIAPSPTSDAWAIPVYSAIVATWGLTGAFLATRRPDNRTGWVLWMLGVGMGGALLGQAWAYLSLALHGGTLPGMTTAAAFGLLFNPMLALALAVPLLFPDGHLPSSRWTVVAVALLGSIAAILVGSVLRPGPFEGMQQIDNPFGITEAAGLADALIAIGNVGFFVCIPASFAASVVRFRQGTPVERKQLAWFGAAMGLAAAAFICATFLPQPYGVASFVVGTIALGLVPVAIGIAILRYRLYEIDRLVSRTLSYVFVTAMLAAVFIGTNLGLQAVLVDATGGGTTLTTAVSTLVIAGLFQPVRRRVQAPIDRRFNRARVDGERVIAAFAGQVRDQMDLDRLRATVVAAADDAVAPVSASLWLRGAR
jgi:hypothetical protein